MFIHGKKGAELGYRYPEPGTVMPLHIFFKKFRDRVITGHRSYRSAQFIRIKAEFLMTAWSMTAAVACLFSGLAGPAAAGIAEFLNGRAFIPVAYALFMVLVYLTACAGVFGGACSCGFFRLVLVGRLCSGFWHGVTMGTDFPYYNYTYAHK